MREVADPGGRPESDAVAGTERDVVVLYREQSGPVRRCGAADLRGLAMEEFAPVSEPVPYRGRRGIITYWPVATREQTVVCGNLRQWRLAVELDFEPAWAAFSASPVELRWRAGGRARRWRPDFVARTAEGVRQVLVLIPPGQESLPATKCDVLETVAQAAGWRVRQVREPSGCADAIWDGWPATGSPQETRAAKRRRCWRRSAGRRACGRGWRTAVCPR